MSNALAIASVTALLKNLLDDGMVDDTVVGSVGSVKVSTLAPDLIALAADAPSQLNLFLYQVTLNASWRNAALPARDARGERLTNPPLALDLHYLLTAYASRELHAEILLGYAMQILHETPLLTRDAIRRGLGDPGLDVDPQHLLPPDLSAIATSGLDRQADSIKVSPYATSPDDMTKLWTALQSKFRPSMAYVVSVVLIESTQPTRVALPVLAPRIYVDTLSSPRIDRVLSQDAAGTILAGAPILAGQRLVLQGMQLDAEGTLVRFGDATAVPDPASLDTQLVVTLPATLLAGLRSVQVIQQRLLGDPPVAHGAASSNLMAFLLRPRIVAVDADSTPGSLHLTLQPAIDPAQRVVVLLNELQPAAAPANPPARAYSFEVPLQAFGSPPVAATELLVALAGVTPGSYLVRLQVDGAESPVFPDALGRIGQPAVSVP